MRWRDIPLQTVRRLVAGAVVVAVLAVAVPLTVIWIQDTRGRCADGVTKKDGPAGKECVGVTDGTHVFADHLKEVTERIKAENAKVDPDEDYVSVAYLTSFTLTGDDNNSQESVRRELQGAYLAQHRHNRGDLNVKPRIKLLIANVGSDSRHWASTTQELIKRRDTQEHLVAVAGLGPSTDQNRKALKRLSKAGLATVSTNMTATDIRDIPGFVRVSPTNVDEAKAAVAYLRERKTRTAMVVQDVAPKELYARSLGDAFTKEFPKKGGKLVAERKTYDSSIHDAWENELQFMANQLCDHTPQAVYFAGRGRHLTHFLNALANRNCQDWDFTMMTGDDTTNLTRRQVAEAAKNGITVFYTGLAHPDMWDADPDAVSARSARYFQDGEQLEKWFSNEPRDDGNAIMAHDAVVTASHGIRMAARWSGTVSGETVGRMFQQMDGAQQVPGASGFLSFQNNGDPRHKAIPILRLTSDGRADLVDVALP